MVMIELPSLQLDHVIAVPEIARPILINRDPGPSEESVPLDSTISLDIVDPGPDGVDRARTQVCVNDVPAFDADAIQPGFDGPDSRIESIPDGWRIVLHPLVPFESQATISIRVVSSTVGGAHRLDETYEFTAEDRTAPKVLAAQAVGPKRVRVGFDEEVEVTDPQGFTFQPLQLPAVPIQSVSAQAQGSVVEIHLDTEMTPDVSYRIRVTGVEDRNHNPAVPPYNRAEFVGFRPPRPANRRFSLWEMIPKHNRRADHTGDLRRFIGCLQEVTDLLLAEVDAFPDIFDIERAPENFLDLILQDLGNPFFFDLSELGKRRLASVLVDLYRLKGHGCGNQNTVRFFLGLECEVLSFCRRDPRLGRIRAGGGLDSGAFRPVCLVCLQYPGRPGSD